MTNPSKSRIAKATTCLDWLDICNASCCRSLSFTIFDGLSNLIKGGLEKFAIEIKEQADSRWYFNLHNIILTDGIVAIDLTYVRFTLKNNRLTLYKKCNNLSKDNLCKGHPDNKPSMCKALTQDTAHDKNRGFNLTDRCLYGYKIGGM